MMSGYFLSVFFGTFLLEDLALASSLALLSEGKLGFFAGFSACFFGICIGDAGLYFLGRWISKMKLERRFPGFEKIHRSFARFRESSVLTYSILISRMIPGTRFPTYVGAGYLKYPLGQFLWLTVSSVFVWVFFALSAGRSLHRIFSDHWVLMMGTFLVCLKVSQGIIPRLMDRWDRSAFFQGWRKWLYFEFWPAWAFYLPIVPYYIFLSIRHRSFLMPFYASPDVENGGLLGESKWDFLKHLNPADSSTLKAVKIRRGSGYPEVREVLDSQGFTYPFMMKPDVGQRGFGVRVIRNDGDLKEYLLLGDFEIIVQRLSLFRGEAGIFYVRKPSEKYGSLFSITDKEFPYVVGDGKRSLGNLILADKRAKIISGIYFERHRTELDRVLDAGERFVLTECGNHCQGTIFLNGEKFSTPALLERIESIARMIPNFYFGRFDVRYRDSESLPRGERFEIVEVNGAGSEATHIWDRGTRLADAYRVLFAQWALLFAIGAEVRWAREAPPAVAIWKFLRECLRVVVRKERLSVSS